MLDLPAFAARAVRTGIALAALLVASFPAAPVRAAVVPDDFLDEPVVSGLVAPANFDFFPDGRLILVEQRTAQVRLIVGDSLAGIDPVGTIADVEIMGPEQGLLGIAIDPRWPESPYVYVFHSVASQPNLRLSRYALTGDLLLEGDGALALDPESRRDILADLPDDYPLHNGGTVEFGPDGMLYLSIGEDGIPCAAQDIHELRGKILRMNVVNVPDGPGFAPSYQSLAAPGNPYLTEADPRARLVWLRGLRNAFSFDFDSFTGGLVIGDVGSADFEEVDDVQGGGGNLGWPLYEGPRRFGFPCAYADSGTFTHPSYWYQRISPKVEAAVMVGGVYHRPPNAPFAFPYEYNGNIFAYDFYEGVLRRLARESSVLQLAAMVAGQLTEEAWASGLEYSTRMRPGPDGGLWYFSAGTQLRRIRYVGPPVTAAPADGLARVELRAFPIPAHGAVTFEYRVAAPGPVQLRIVDAAGRRVRALVQGAVSGIGPHRVVWDGRDDAGQPAPAGIYFAVVHHGGGSTSRRVVRLGG